MSPEFCKYKDTMRHFNSPTSNDAEELLDPHVDINPAEKLVHVAPPLLQGGADGLAGTKTGSAASRFQTFVCVGLTCEHFAQPAQNQL